MAVTSNRLVQVKFTGDISFNQPFSASESLVSPGTIEVKTLALGANTITPPSVSGVTVKGVTIIPPEGNTSLMTLKGVTGDTGIPLHLTDPTSLGLDTTLTTFVINAAASIVGVRFIWS